jgi:hypothetical protein
MMKTSVKLAIAACGLGLVLQANASLYDVTFSATDSSGVAATGTIDVLAGVATGGSMDVTGGAYAGIYTLVPAVVSPGSYTFNSYGSFSYDSLASPGSTPFLNQASIYGGLVWENAGNTVEFKMFYNEPSYASQIAGAVNPDIPNEYGLLASPSINPFGYAAYYGSATLTAVPEPMTILSGALLLLPLGASALRILRRPQVS